MNDLRMRNRKYDLEKRTARFGGDVISLTEQIREDEVTKPLMNRLVQAATSLGARYCEADKVRDKEGFRDEISLCQQEASKSNHFLQMIAHAVPKLDREIQKLRTEAKELDLIFDTIIMKVS